MSDFEIISVVIMIASLICPYYTVKKAFKQQNEGNNHKI